MAMGGKQGLKDKQQRFVEEYLIDLNATQAAIRAGYSAKTAQAQGSRLLTNVFVAAEIEVALSKRSIRTEITQDMVVAELAKIGFSDLRKILTSGGYLVEPQDWDDGTAGAIASLEVVTLQTGETDGEGRKIVDRVHKIKTWDKRAALVDLGKHLGMFREKVEVVGKGDTDLELIGDAQLARVLSFVTAKAARS